VPVARPRPATPDRRRPRPVAAGAIAALLDGAGPYAALRRSLPPGATTILRVINGEALLRLVQRRFLEAIVVSPTRVDVAVLRELLAEHPAPPVVLYAAFRPEHALALVQWRRFGVAAMCVEGVEDAIAGEIVWQQTRRMGRLAALAATARVLRCETPLQRTVWARLLTDVESPPRTATLAREHQVTRETLSRQFAAGDAPNLKRAIDAARVVAAAQAMASPGGTPALVARQLHFTSASHLHATVRRITGGPVSALAALGPQGVLRAFARGRMRSAQ
jgi:AraC-like DNA-binding protein